jgi:MFS family permease
MFSNHNRAAGSSTYVPAIQHIQQIYHVKRVVATLPLSFYVFGFCIGPIFTAPLSELYGRRNIYWVSVPTYMIFTAIAGAANNVPLLIIARFLASAGGSAPFAIAAGMIFEQIVSIHQLILTLLQEPSRICTRIKVIKVAQLSF